MLQSQIVVRRPRIDFDQEIDRYYFGGNPIKTHILNALNLTFPQGERFFVKSVHDHVPGTRDPALAHDIKAFAAQEGHHANQHERYFQAMKRHGYDIAPFATRFDRLAAHAKSLPRALRLAITAGAEHYTATLAALLLELDMFDDMDPTLRSLLLWHAVEEIEHKHVAYDTLLHHYKWSYPLRLYGFITATLVIFFYVPIAYRMLLKQDLRAQRLDRTRLEQAQRAFDAPREKQLRKRMRRTLLQYLKPGFHPNQQDDSQLLERYRARADAVQLAAQDGSV